ncbi:ribosome silencing factor [Murdochiella vaginalis]|uniref:ribosome silencing factor n=1 Tax=Murdochiella vaginalis TaxID=1852373 RepID=UPI0008FD9D33|nr:ribosome silencing factor [Murdochiella vaginalis]
MTESKKNLKNDIIVQAAEDKQARDIRTLPIREEAGICDYFIVMTGRNKIHTQAIADAITQKLAQAEMPPITTEGLRDGGWILLDCAETIVHIFTQSEREFYDLDDLWSE